MDYSFIDKYNELRHKIEDLVDENPDLLGGDKWLRYVIDSNKMTLTDNVDHISCFGTVYSTQTMDHEWFSFDIPKELLT